MVNPTSYAATQEQSQAPKRRAPGVVANTLFLGGVGAVAGSTFWAPVAIKTPEALLGLENDKFESTMKRVKEKAPQEAQQGKKTLVEQKKAIDAVLARNDKELAELFPEGVSEVHIDDIVSKKFKVASFADAEAKLANLAAEHDLKSNFTSYLTANEGKVLDRAAFADHLVQKCGHSDIQAEGLVEHLFPAEKQPGRVKKFFSSFVPKRFKKAPKQDIIRTNDVLKTFTGNKKMTKELFLQTENVEELKSFTEFVKKTPLNEGKMAKETYSGLLAEVHKPNINTETSKTAYDAIKKYLPKKRLQGALKFGGIAVGTSVLVSLIASKLMNKGNA